MPSYPWVSLGAGSDAGHNARPQFTGEGEAFVHWGAPLLSTTGAGIDFHTPDDTPERVTSPAALTRVADAYLGATVAFLDAVGAR